MAPSPLTLAQRAAAVSPAGMVLRAAEMLTLYIAVPLALTVFIPTRTMAALLFPALWVGCGLCLVVLRLDPTFDRTQLWNRRGFRAGLRGLILSFVLLAPIVALAVYFWNPDIFLSFPRERPRIWAIVMVGYPLASVYAQEIIWRTYFFHRFEPLLAKALGAHSAGSPDQARAVERSATLLTVLLSGLLFGFMHILFKHWAAVALTIAIGWLFSFTYARWRSIALVWLEHALWGCFAFTVGLGSFFYLGGVAMRQAP